MNHAAPEEVTNRTRRKVFNLPATPIPRNVSGAKIHTDRTTATRRPVALRDAPFFLDVVSVSPGLRLRERLLLQLLLKDGPRADLPTRHEHFRP